MTSSEIRGQAIMSKSGRSALAHETVAIVDRGTYQVGAKTIDLAGAIRDCLAATRSYSPEEVNSLRRVSLARANYRRLTRIELVNETTLAGIARVQREGDDSVAALNFASARNPGGGFLNGAHAQEESLARSSALYASLLQAGDFYDRHRQSSSLLYSDAMILSPGCPIFRDDAGQLLETPHLATFLTSPAPNAGAIAAQRPSERSQVVSVLRRRAELILALGAATGASTLVLGAWGCGVFRNDPATVAAAFADLVRGGIWAGSFDRIVFSVLDESAGQRTFEAFGAALA